MSGVNRMVEIFERYSKFEIDTRSFGKPVCVFSNPNASPAHYAAGNGFVMAGGSTRIAHDDFSLERFLESADGIVPDAVTKPWREALDALRKAAPHLKAA
jgi:hypothetical protein